MRSSGDPAVVLAGADPAIRRRGARRREAERPGAAGAPAETAPAALLARDDLRQSAETGPVCAVGRLQTHAGLRNAGRAAWYGVSDRQLHSPVFLPPRIFCGRAGFCTALSPWSAFSDMLRSRLIEIFWSKPKTWLSNPGMSINNSEFFAKQAVLFFALCLSLPGGYSVGALAAVLAALCAIPTWRKKK